jgi:hypothetical protein
VTVIEITIGSWPFKERYVHFWLLAEIYKSLPGSDSSPEFYAAGFQWLVKRWDKCLNVQREIKVFFKSVLLFV